VFRFSVCGMIRREERMAVSGEGEVYTCQQASWTFGPEGICPCSKTPPS
jgi:hypothetical protein